MFIPGFYQVLPGFYPRTTREQPGNYPAYIKDMKKEKTWE